MRIDRFENIDAWKHSRGLVKAVYGAIKASDSFKKDFHLVSQIQRAAVSAMSNIAEGFSRRSNKEFIRFLFIAKSSAAEVQSQLYVALDQNYINNETFQGIYGQAELVAKTCSGFIKYLNTTNLPKPKEHKEP